MAQVVRRVRDDSSTCTSWRQHPGGRRPRLLKDMRVKLEWDQGIVTDLISREKDFVCHVCMADEAFKTSMLFSTGGLYSSSWPGAAGTGMTKFGAPPELGRSYEYDTMVPVVLESRSDSDGGWAAKAHTKGQGRW